MPTVEVDLEDLELLLGTQLPREEEKLNEVLSYIKGEAKGIESNEIRIELKDSNRADIWSVEGIARALRGYLGLERGFKDYHVEGRSGVTVQVDSKLKKIRPYIACSVVKGVRLTDTAIRQMMHFQDKMDQTYGRNRRRTSIGLYDYDLISPPLRYGVAKPDEVSFVPLDFDEKLTLREILKKHPKGIEYGHIVQRFPVWPIFMDSANNVLSFPPIINSNDLGHVTPSTENVLVEVTGTSVETVQNTLTNVTLALADRGGKIYSAKIQYPYGNIRSMTTPNLKGETFELGLDYVMKVIGIQFTLKEIRELLGKARYGVMKASKNSLVVKVPCYRVDVLHPIDIVEDIAIAYNYNKIQQQWPRQLTIGGLSNEAEFRDVVRELMVGLGFQEILTFIMSSPETLFTKMNVKSQRVVEIANPRLSSMTCLRNWLLPSLMEFLSHNTHVDYPQKVFEVGHCVVHNEQKENKTDDIETLACVTIHANASFTEAKSFLDALLTNLGAPYSLREESHESFIQGRAGKIIIGEKEIGIIGEIHPQVLQNWGLENPAAAFEININKVRQHIFSKP
ncbi:phenylalanine--tRNA ligase subunit beta [Candidatus Bathyarchaeota archaeon]|nr:phenylalanine--tRNA ligase subunit beta [Candidatus Bathyarchaeota archaeon]